ncbi:MAG: TonB-dependent receptor [Cyclobacteriaceae bacterium]
MKRNGYSLKKSFFYLLLSVVATHSVHSQGSAAHLNENRNTKNAPRNEMPSLTQSIKELETKHNAFIIYNLKAVENKKDLVAHKPTSFSGIEESLQNLLSPVGLDYERVDDNVFVIVMPGEEKGNVSRKNSGTGFPDKGLPKSYLRVEDRSTLRTSTLDNSKEAAFKVSGRITNEQGETLVGANVILTGTSIGTTSDVSGNYVLEIPDPAGTLIFSYIGYSSQEIPVNNRQIINISLVPDVQSLKEVQIVGYGTQAKAEVTSAIASVSSEEIKDMPLIGLDQALQGRAAGVQVTNNSGAPGGGVSIRIRGTSSLGAGNEPLYVIDGVPINNSQTFNQQTGEERINGMSNINPADIESIEILKDAASTSIYGARAANGVVLITTKRGKAGTQQFDLNTWYGFSQVANRYDLLGASDFAVLVNEGLATVNVAPVFTQEFIDNPTTDTDWQSEIFRTAPTANANFSMRGGSDKTQYMLSLGYMDQQGVIIESRFKRYSLRVNLDQKINDKIKIGNSLNVSYSNNDRLRNTGAARSDGGEQNFLFGSPVLTTAHARSPATPVRDPVTGGYSFDPLARLFPNPVAMAEAQDINNNTVRIIGNVFGEYEIIKGLRFRTQLGTDVRYENEDFFMPPFPDQQQGNGTGRASVRNFNELLWLTENYLTYDFKLGQNHNFQTLAGASFQESQWESNFAYVAGFGSDRIKTLNGGSQILTSTSDAESWGIASYFGRLNYNFSGKYLLSLNYRVDGSSRFGANNKYGHFPSASIGWNVIEEDFMKGIPVITNLKLRGSYGITGNQEIGNYSHLGTFGVGGGTNLGRNYLNRLGSVVNNIPNDDFSWEQTTQMNAGVDLGLFNNRLSVSADYYVKTTTDLLLNIPLPRTSGFASTLTNIGEMENKGIELGVNTINVDGDFSWQTNFNFSMNQNKVLSLVGGQDIRLRESIVREGYPISFYLLERERYVDPTTGVTLIVDKDASGGVPNDNDRSIAGNPFPKHIGGITNEFRYKGFDLTVFFQWSYGNKIFNNTRKWMEEMRRDLQSTIGYNTTREAFDNRWQESGDQTEYPGVFYDLRNQNHFLSHTGWLEDGSYLRLKTLTLGYNFPTSFNERLGLSNARVYFSSNNLLTFTSYSGYDPEVNHFTAQGLGGNVGIGYDYGTFPQPKTFVMGVNLSF